MLPVVLASTSIYKKKLFARLAIPFSATAPLFEENKYKKKDLDSVELAKQLAYEKARSIAKIGQITIGADQIVSMNNIIYNKPMSKDRAIQQLLELQGKTHSIITAYSVFYNLDHIENVVINNMTMKKLRLNQIQKYIELDQPFDCAGSYKIELHGISLFEKIEGDDFTAIEGLPLIALSQNLQQYQVEVLKNE